MPATETLEKKRSRTMGRLVVEVFRDDRWHKIEGLTIEFKGVVRPPQSTEEAKRALRDSNPPPGEYRVIRIADEFEVKTETKTVFE